MSLDLYRGEHPLEVREADGSPGHLTGVIVPSGRVASDRREIFIGAGIQTPAEGIRLLAEHRSSTTVMTFEPVRDPDGTIRIDHRLPDSPEGRAVAAAVRDGSKSALSAEFHSLDDATVSGVREVRQSLVVAVATVPAGAYHQARAEVRSQTGHRRVLTWL